MSYPILKPNSTWFAPNVSTIKRSTITAINIVDTYTPEDMAAIADSWDASASQDGSIMCYVEGTILTVAGNGSGQIQASQDSSYTFSDIDNVDFFSAVTEINGLDILDTSLSTDMNRMFYKCAKLTTIDVGNFNTSMVTNMSYMFGTDDKSNTMKLTSINFGENFDTSNVIDFSGMFERCTVIQNIDVSNFDFTSAITVKKMFNNCKALTYLDVSKWDTSHIQNFCALFQQCNNLTEFSVAHFNTSSATDMGFMFYKCTKFTKIDVEDWDVSNVETFDHFIANARNITEFDTSRWNVTNKCKNLNAIFHSYKGESIDIRSWDTSNVEVFAQMFDSCPNLTEIKGLESLDTSNGKDFTQMFYANKIKHLDLSSIDTTHAIPNYPLGSNGTKGGGMYQFMYMTWNNLEKITLGEKLSFDGDGSCTLDTPSEGSPHCYFQFPNSSSGYWYTVDGVAYTPAEIEAMENPAGTYYATELLAKYDRNKNKLIDLNGMEVYHAENIKYINEAVNAPKTELILSSSIEGSTKQFKLTIDDNGTLTVSEIVVEEVK